MAMAFYHDLKRRLIGYVSSVWGTLFPFSHGDKAVTPTDGNIQLVEPKPPNGGNGNTPAPEPLGQELTATEASAAEGEQHTKPPDNADARGEDVDLPAPAAAEQVIEAHGKDEPSATGLGFTDDQPTVIREVEPPATENNSQPEQAKNTTAPPRKSGARRHRTGAGAGASVSKPQLKRPELICRETRHGWNIFLQAAEAHPIEHIRQGGESWRAPPQGQGGEWKIDRLREALEVTAGGQPFPFVLHEDKHPLIFKCGQDWHGTGRRVSRITHGCFLVIAPKAWTRRAPPPVAATACADDDFRAHYFYGEADNLGKDLGFDECLLASGDGFELQGERLADDSEQGELFIGAAPLLEVADSVVWARVGEERKGGWRGENFDPHKQSLSAVLNGRPGRFFVRVYETDGAHPVLLDSGQFRYLPRLQAILVNGAPYENKRLMLPPADGYAPARVEFRSTDQTLMRPELAGDTHEPALGGAVVEKTPHPDSDHLACRFPHHGTVEIALTLPRIWWGIAAAGDAPDRWHSKPLVMPRPAFIQHARDGHAILVRPPLGYRAIRVGFGTDIDRQYPREKDEPVRLPFKDFRDYSQVERPYERAALCIECAGQTLNILAMPAALKPEIVRFICEPAQIMPGQAAFLSWQTRHTADAAIRLTPGNGAVPATGEMRVSPAATTDYTLTIHLPEAEAIAKTIRLPVLAPPEPGATPVIAYVKAGGGWRRGKGFSRGELAAAGFPTGPDAGNIKTDQRRKSIHQRNIDTLEETRK